MLCLIDQSRIQNPSSPQSASPLPTMPKPHSLVTHTHKYSSHIFLINLKNHNQSTLKYIYVYVYFINFPYTQYCAYTITLYIVHMYIPCGFELLHSLNNVVLASDSFLNPSPQAHSQACLSKTHTTHFKLPPPTHLSPPHKKQISMCLNYSLFQLRLHAH